MHAIGEAVCRSFGEDGIFHGVVTAFRREVRTELYTVEYTDGDCEEMDKEEYNFGYALWLREEGWNAEEGEVVVRTGKKKKLEQQKESIAEKKLAKLQEVVDLTSKKSIAGKHINNMDAVGKKGVIARLAKTAQKNENKIVKVAVVEESYGTACKEAFVAHLLRAQQDVNSMVHARRKSIVEELGLLATIKVGDWVDIEQDYSPGIISDGGISCVCGLHTEAHGQTLHARTIALDVHYIIDNRKERGVDKALCGHSYAI